VVIGIGMNKYVLNVQRDGHLMIRDNANKLVISVHNLILMVNALSAIKDMILNKELVLFLSLLMPSHLILDVANGIGTINYALHAQRDGPLMLKINVFPLMTNANNINKMAYVSYVSKVISS
jgi:hypothetical protein